MRDIGTRIQRYRLTRYGSPETPPLHRRMRWIWPALGLWGLWIGVLSDHSVLRLARMKAEHQRMQAELANVQRELEDLDHQLKDPGARRALGEKTLRERSGWARPKEIIYRIEGEPDTVR